MLFPFSISTGSLVTCWQQLASFREISNYTRFSFPYMTVSLSASSRGEMDVESLFVIEFWKRGAESRVRWMFCCTPSTDRRTKFGKKNFNSLFLAGDFMKDKYDGATEVRVNKRGRLQVKNAQYNLPTANDLVYLDESPDYCLRNKTIGSFGT